MNVTFPLFTQVWDLRSLLPESTGSQFSSFILEEGKEEGCAELEHTVREQDQGRQTRGTDSHGPREKAPRNGQEQGMPPGA